MKFKAVEYYASGETEARGDNKNYKRTMKNKESVDKFNRMRSRVRNI